ncbi:MAG: hypothetical protein PWQ51_52 [Methanolobus sp.]|jgi:uncharacterized membrane protein|nr:hypothetical protein [Methanolobus sp.]
MIILTYKLLSSIDRDNKNGRSSLDSKFYFKIISYIYLLALFIIPVLFLSYAQIMFSDANSARYMISALIQSEAAILGIVITLSLLVVQQSATSLSPRVISIFRNFKKNPDFYLLMMIYLGAMLYNSLVLKAIKENLSYDYVNFNSLELSSTIGIGNFTISIVESSASFEA